MTTLENFSFRLIKPLVLLLLAGLHTAVQGQSQTRADKLLEMLVTEKKIVGVSAGYTIEGEMSWMGASGFACRDKGSQFLPTTKTRIASIAKPMTATAVMQLVEKGLIQLDSSIQMYLPDFPDKEKGDITVRQLLAHTSGIPQYQSTKEVENTHFFASLQEAMQVFQDRPLLFQPGTDFFYTSYGYVILGRIIESVSGMSYAQYMKAAVWEPAGMLDTGIEITGTGIPGKSCLYHRKKSKAKDAQQNDLSNRIPGGGFYSTLHDVLKFGNALLDGTLIRSGTLEKMIEIQLKEKEGNPYALGWFLYGPPPNQDLVIGHSGEQTGCASQLMIIPKSKTVVAVLSNTSGTWKDIVSFSAELIRISEEE